MKRNYSNRGRRITHKLSTSIWMLGGALSVNRHIFASIDAENLFVSFIIYQFIWHLTFMWKICTKKLTKNSIAQRQFIGLLSELICVLYFLHLRDDYGGSMVLTVVYNLHRFYHWDCHILLIFWTKWIFVYLCACASYISYNFKGG